MTISSNKGCLFHEIRHECQIANRFKVLVYSIKSRLFLIKDGPKLPSSPQGNGQFEETY